MNAPASKHDNGLYSLPYDDGLYSVKGCRVDRNRVRDKSSCQLYTLDILYHMTMRCCSYTLSYDDGL